MPTILVPSSRDLYAPDLRLMDDHGVVHAYRPVYVGWDYRDENNETQCEYDAPTTEVWFSAVHLKKTHERVTCILCLGSRWCGE